MSIEFKGAEALKKILREAPKEAESAIIGELKIIAADLQGKAQRLAPVEFGDLRGSAFAVVGKSDVSVNTEADTDPGTPRLAIPGAGKLGAVIGFSEPYALAQHEEVEYRHPKGGQAKYLEQPYKENVDKYVKELSEAIRKAVDK